MRTLTYIPATLGILLMLAGCVAFPQLPPRPTGDDFPSTTTPPAGSLELQVHQLVNDRRRSVGLPRLEWNTTLSDLAARHSEEMASGRRSFGHDGFDARAAEARSRLSVTRFSENVATNNYSPGQVAGRAVEGWIASPGHRRNLEGDYQLTGVGVARSASGDYFITQLYASR